jgi:hypothetical protein
VYTFGAHHLRALRRPVALDGRPVSAASDLSHLDELEAESLDPVEHSVQRRLVDDRSAQNRLSRLDLGIEPVETRQQAIPDSPPDANLVAPRSHEPTFERRRVKGHHPVGVTTPHPSSTHGVLVSKRRNVAVWTLVALATVLAFVSSLTVWTKRQLLDTKAWTNTSSELLADPEIRDALSIRLVDGLYQRVDVAAELRARLPKAAQGAAPAAAAALQTAAVRATEAFLATPRAQALWEQANRRAHGALIRVLEGKDVGPVSTANGAVVLDVRPLLGSIATRLGIEDKLRDRASPTTGLIVLLRSDQLGTAQTAVQTLKVLSVFLALVVLALYGIAIWLARGRRRFILQVTGASLFFAGLLVLIVRRIAGNAIVDSLVETRANREPVNHVWALETAMLRDIALALVFYGIAAIVAGWLAGPTRPAVWIRRSLAPTFRRSALAVHGVALAIFLIFVAWGPTGATRRLLGIVILYAVVVVGIEAWRRQTIREFPAEAASPVGADEADTSPEPAKKPALS